MAFGGVHSLSRELPLLALFGISTLIAILSCVAIGLSAVDSLGRTRPAGWIQISKALTIGTLFGSSNRIGGQLEYV